MCPNPPPSDDACNEPAPGDDLSGLRAAAKRLIDAIAAEPVPEQLRELAVELGKALEHQRNKGMEEDSSTPG